MTCSWSASASARRRQLRLRLAAQPGDYTVGLDRTGVDADDARPFADIAALSRQNPAQARPIPLEAPEISAFCRAKSTHGGPPLSRL
jgi:hypothetical protein